MKASELQKVLGFLHDTASDAFDHLASRLTATAEELGEEFAELAEFAASWSKLKKASRKLFVEQLLKSSGLVIASSLATKAGLSAAGKTQKQLRKALLTIADVVEPAGKRTAKKIKKIKKAGKKTAGKAKKKLKKK